MRYIYNYQQASYMIQQGCNPIKIDKHLKTGKVFWVFDKESSQVAYLKWVTRTR